MADLQWRAEIGGKTEEGIAQNPVGSLHVRCSAPAGVIASVTARMQVEMSDEERAFFNGYQTWTYSPEYRKKDRMRGLGYLPGFLVNQYALDRYGDYHFMPYSNKPGQFHGFSWCYFRHHDRFRLFASLDEGPGYTIFCYDSRKNMLTIERDCAGVEHPGGEMHLFDLFFAEGTEEEVFDAWFSAMGIVPRTDQPVAGYSSWYNHYEDITQETIYADLEGCSALLSPGDLFQIDDGWEPAVGDWLEPNKSKFPDGMRAACDKIHAAGFKAGLWLAPYVCAAHSSVLQQHPDWLLKVRGRPWKCGINWGGFYSLDFDVPQVQDYLHDVFDRVFGEWDFDLVKLDFLYGAAPFPTRTESRAAHMIRAMELLRQWCGDKLILGCGVPVMPAFGRTDYCRVSCDVGLDWDSVWYMRRLHRERVSTKQAINNTVFRRQLNGRAYLSDPDVFFLRDDNIQLTDRQKQDLATVDALLGSVWLTSDNPARYGQETRERYRQLRELRQATDVRVHADGGLRITYMLHGKPGVLELD